MSTYLERNSYQLANGDQLSLEHTADGFDIKDFGNPGGEKFALSVYSTKDNQWHELKDSQVSSKRQAQEMIDSHTQTLQDNKFELKANADEPHSEEYLRLKAEHLAHEERTQ